MTLSAAKRLAPVLILVSFGLDQLSKTWAHSFVGPGNAIAVFPGFNLVAITNSGTPRNYPRTNVRSGNRPRSDPMWLRLC